MNTKVSLASGSWTASGWFYGLYSGIATLFRGDNDHQILVYGGDLGTYLSATGFYGPSPAVPMGGYVGQAAWNQVTAVGSGGNTSFYIDGNFVGSTTGAESVSNIYAIGNWQSGGQPFAQYVDDVNIYQTALSAAQVKTLYAYSANSFNVLPIQTPVQIASGATLDLNGASQQVASLNDYVSGSQGAVTNTAATPATLTLAPSGGTAIFSGSIGDGSGGVSLVLNGNGTQILAGSNTYSGATTISAGTLQIGNGGSGEYLASPTISNSGALVFNHADTLTYAGAISGSGQLTEQGGGMLILSGNNTYTGATTISGATLQIGNGTSGEGLSSPTIALNNGATLAFNHADGLSYSGAISGSGQLIKLGSGNLDLVGSGTYSGPTTISAGTVELDGNGDNLPAATALTIASSGVLDLAGNPLTVGSLSGSAGAVVTNKYANYPATLTVAPSSGSTTTFAGNIIGNNALAISGSGELTLSGTNAYTGGTTVSGGTLDIAAPIALSGSGLVTIAAGGRLVFGERRGHRRTAYGLRAGRFGAAALSAAASAPATLGGYESAFRKHGDARRRSGVIARRRRKRRRRFCRGRPRAGIICPAGGWGSDVGSCPQAKARLSENRRGAAGNGPLRQFESVFKIRAADPLFDGAGLELLDKGAPSQVTCTCQPTSS